MLNSYGEYKKPKSKFQLVKEEQEKAKNEIYKERMAEQEKARIAYEAEQERKRLEDEANAEKIALEAEAKLKDRKDYVEKVKAEYTPEKMKGEVALMVDTLAKYDKHMVVQVIDTYFREEIDKLVDMYHIVFKDIPAEDPIKQAVLSIFQISMGQKIGDASHDLLSES